MPFPDTRVTLIIRISQGGAEADWRQFLDDYWGPVVRFAARCGGLPFDQAEDVASETFLVLVRSALLARWGMQPTGKLRGLLCGVVRNLLSNRQRVAQGRRRLLQQVVEAGGVPDVLNVSETPEPTSTDLDAFYRAWVDELLARTMRQLLHELHAAGRGDYYRALYGRICEELSAEEIGQALGVDSMTVENYLRAAKSRLTGVLTQTVREDIEKYSASESVEADFEREWAQLRAYLELHGGLEEAIRREAASLDRLPNERSPRFQTASSTICTAATGKLDGTTP